MDEISKLKRSLSLKEVLIFIGADVSHYTRNNGKNLLHRSSSRVSVRLPDLIQTIDEFDCPLITTNDDSLLEEILDRNSMSWKEYLVENDLKNSILHLDGYQKENTSDRSALKVLIEGKTLLFIGYSSEVEDSHYSNILQWINQSINPTKLPMYRLSKFDLTLPLFSIAQTAASRHVIEIRYGNDLNSLVPFLETLKSLTFAASNLRLTTSMKDEIRRKYLEYLIEEYGRVALFGYSDRDITLPLQSVYVELKFDPTDPSIKAMKTIEIHEEFKRRLISPEFFTDEQRQQLNRAIIERNAYNPETIHRDLMVDQWLNVLLSNRKIFTDEEAEMIKTKVDELKTNILKQNNLKEAKQYHIQQAYNEFKHFIVLGHPGSGKTTLSKWLVTNMAKHCLGQENLLFTDANIDQQKIPILIPIWKYIDQSKGKENEQRSNLLQFLYENPTFDSTYFTPEDRWILSRFMMNSLLEGNVLIIFEGLDEVPAYVDRTHLIKEMNEFLERSIEYDSYSNRLVYSRYERKEINRNTTESTMVNRCVITSRIEGNYFEDLNFSIPRLTIENMSDEALQLFCRSYMRCIEKLTKTNDDELVQSNQFDRLYNDITQNKDIFQLAINPQLASVIAAIYHQYGDKLPENRIDLYEKAIAMMIERVVTLHFDRDIGHFDSRNLWTIWQEIADYLHNRVEGLSEEMLKTIIKQCLNNDQQDNLVLHLVDIFKYQAGLLNEFGYDSFRFIHRTFQEYLAAKSIVYSNGRMRTETKIYEKIREKIALPNWRVPLSMTFGILSRSDQFKEAFLNLIDRLLNDEQSVLDGGCSTQLLPFVMIDSFNDICFSSDDTIERLIRNLADTLLVDYKNLLGFSRLKDHQDLIHVYFAKLNVKFTHILTDWFVEKIQDEENRAPCANILLKLDWYQQKFHQIFIQNLSSDSSIWHWPIDSLLRYYSQQFKDDSVQNQLIFRSTLKQNVITNKSIVQNFDWLSLIVTLYGGYSNFRIAAAIKEYHETSQFLGLTEVERMPFLLYYEEVWGRDEPVYQMALHLDNDFTKDLWKTKPIYDRNNIYKDSSLTSIIREFFLAGRTTEALLETLLMQIQHEQLNGEEKIDIFIIFIILGRADQIENHLNNETEKFKMHLKNRIEQIMQSLHDPIARFSSQISAYLMALYNKTKLNRLNSGLLFSDYCQIFLSFIVKAGGLPVDMDKLASIISDSDVAHHLYAENIAYQFTGASDDFQGNLTKMIDECLQSDNMHRIVHSILKLNDAVQWYRPVRAYPWPVDAFLFDFPYENDLSISFFNCLENLPSKAGNCIQVICEGLVNQGYLHENLELIPLVILLNFGIMSKDVNMQTLFEQLLPDMPESSDVKEFLFERIQNLVDPYFKSRALYQLAQFHDEGCRTLLHQSFQLTEEIDKPILKFQVLEKIYTTVHHKNIIDKEFLQQIRESLTLTCDSIEGFYNQIIAAVRLSFYGSRDWRKTYLTKTVTILEQMDEVYEKVKVMKKLKPIVAIYPDLYLRFERIVRTMKNQTYQSFFEGYSGRILSSEKIAFTCTNPSSTPPTDSSNYGEIEKLFSTYAQLNDMQQKLDPLNNTNQLWIDLLRNPDDTGIIQKLIKIGLDEEFFLSPQIAIIIDEFLENNQAELISTLFPYIIKPSNEVIPIVEKWFIHSHHPLTKQFSALLLTEAKWIFASAIDPLIQLLKSEHDQLRYRAQRVFQHPERDVSEPSKKLSVIGETTLLNILRANYRYESMPRVRAYLSTFFIDLLWDDVKAFEKISQTLLELLNHSTLDESKLFSLSRIIFINEEVWNALIRSISPSTPVRYVEQMLHAAMNLTKRSQITDDQWTTFVQLLTTFDLTQFRNQIYFVIQDIAAMTLIMDEIVMVRGETDETYLEVLEAKIIDRATISIDLLPMATLIEIENMARSNFNVSTDQLNEATLTIINSISLNADIFGALLKWLIAKMMDFDGHHDTLFSLVLCEHLLSIVAACVQKEHYLYRKITNDQQFDKIGFIQLLDKFVHQHPFFPSRGTAFVILAALDHSDHQVIIDSLSTLFDENVVKEYTAIGLPLVHLSPNEFIDELLESLNNESSVKVYETLKIFTQYTLSEKIDANSKSKILAYIVNAIAQLKSQRPINYYYTDIKIPFTTTLENELYKAWIKIQGLSGKSQYLSELKKARENN